MRWAPFRVSVAVQAAVEGGDRAAPVVVSYRTCSVNLAGPEGPSLRVGRDWLARGLPHLRAAVRLALGRMTDAPLQRSSNGCAASGRKATGLDSALVRRFDPGLPRFPAWMFAFNEV